MELDNMRKTDPYNTVFVGNLDCKTTYAQLRTFFINLGCHVRHVFLQKSREPPKISKRSGFVVFATAEDVQKALTVPKAMTVFHGRRLTISPAGKKKLGVHEKNTLRSMLKPKNDAMLEQEISGPAAKMVGLSEDIMPLILSYMSVEDLLNAEKVCKMWHQMALKVWSLKTTLKFGRQNPAALKILSEHEYRKLMKRCGRNLVEIDAKYMVRPVDTVAIEQIVKNCPNLKKLIIFGAPLRNRDVEYLADGLPELEDITLECCSRITEIGFSKLFEKCQKLKIIRIFENMNIKGACIFALGPNVEELNLCDCVNVIAEGFAEIGFMCSKLETLCLDGCDLLTADTFTHIYSGCPNIKTLSLKYLPCFIGRNNGLYGLAAFSNLVSLDLSVNHVLKDRHLHLVGNVCPKLELLDISHCEDITDKGISYLKPCIHLKTLKIERLDEVTGVSLVSISKTCPLEEVLCADCTNMCNGHLINFVKCCPLLKYLDVSYCTEVTDWLILEVLLEIQKNRDSVGPLLRIIIPGTKAQSVSGANRFWHRFLEIDGGNI